MSRNVRIIVLNFLTECGVGIRRVLRRGELGFYCFYNIYVCLNRKKRICWGSGEVFCACVGGDLAYLRMGGQKGGCESARRTPLQQKAVLCEWLSDRRSVNYGRRLKGTRFFWRSSQ